MVVAVALVGCSLQPKDEIIVENKSNVARTGEMVEVDASQFEVAEGESLVVRNAQGDEIPSQVTYDGKLIFQVDVEAGGVANFTVESGKAADYQTYACGRVYPERVDDVAWESDLIAFRAYGPALQKSGERAFGYDVWVKNNTSLPVVEERYNKELNPETKAKIAELRKTNPAEADALAASVSYHNDHGNGFDAYKVGPTLGGGATAVLEGGKIVYPYCWAECQVVDNGPLRWTAQLTYNPTKLKGGKEVVESRTISINKGSFLNKTSVCYKGADVDVMAGIVLHEEQPRTYFDSEKYYITYAEPVEAPDGGELYQAMYFPEGWSGAENRLWSRKDDKPAGAYGHAAAYKSLADGEPMTYWWGALWNKSTEVEVATKEAFDKLMAEVVAAKAQPLVVTTVVYGEPEVE